MSEGYADIIHPLSEIENENLLILEEKQRGVSVEKEQAVWYAGIKYLMGGKRSEKKRNTEVFFCLYDT